LGASFLDGPGGVAGYFIDYVYQQSLALFYNSSNKQICVVNNIDGNTRVRFTSDGGNDLQTFNINSNGGFTINTTIDPPSGGSGSGSGLINNFVLTCTDGEVIPQSVYSNVTLDDAGNFALTIISPQVLGATLDSPIKSFSLSWVSSNPTLFTLVAPATLTVNALDDFTTTTITLDKTTMTFEETCTITCTAFAVINEPNVPVSGTYKLYHSLADPVVYTEIASSYSTTDSQVFTFKPDQVDTTQIADHLFYFKFIVTDITGTPDPTYFRQTSDTLTLTVTAVSTDFNLTIEDSTQTPQTTFDINTILKIHAANLQTQTVPKHTVPGTLNIQYRNNGGVYSSLNPITVDDSNTTDWYSPSFSVLSKYIPINTTSFIVTFNPTDSVHFNSSTHSVNTRITSSNSLSVETFTFSKSSYSYWEEYNFTMKITPQLDSHGGFIPIVGTLSILANGQQEVFNNSTITINNDQLVTITTGLRPYYLANSVVSPNNPYSFTVTFTPSGSYTYYPPYSDSFSLTITAQEIVEATIISDRTSYYYDQLMVLDFVSSDPYIINGLVTFTLTDSNGNVTTLTDDTKILNNKRLSRSTGNSTLSIRNSMDFTTESAIFVISATFKSTDTNYMDGITSVITKTVTFYKSHVKMTSLNITTNDDTETIDDQNTYFIDGITVVKGVSIVFDGYLVNTDTANYNQPEPVKNGVVTIYTKNEIDTTNGDINIHEHTYSDLTSLGTMTVDSNGHFTNIDNPFIPLTSREIYLSYQNITDYLIQDFIYDGQYVTIPGNFYINVINTPYTLTMKYLDDSEYIDYHDGEFNFNITMSFPLTSQLLTDIDNQRQGGANVGKFVVTICDVDNNLNVVYTAELDPIVGVENTTGLFQTGHPRTFVLSDMTTGLNAGNYQFTSSFEGIQGEYDAQEAIDVDSGNKYINFMVFKTSPKIQMSLSKNDIFYRERPTLTVKVQTPATIDSDYHSYNDLLGTSTVVFSWDSSNLMFIDTSNNNFDMTDWTLTDVGGLDSVGGQIVAGHGSVNNKTITNIENLKVVLLPIIPLYTPGRTSYSVVNTVGVIFRPSDTVNYKSGTGYASRTSLPITIRPYTPVLNDIVFTPSDGTTASNVTDSREYNIGVINYDEPFNIDVFRQRYDEDPAVDYSDLITLGNIIYTYRNIATNEEHTIDVTQMGTQTISRDDANVDYVTTVLAQQIVVNQINTPDGLGFENSQFLLSVQFIPHDPYNYTRSNVFSKNFALYIANATGNINLSLDRYLMKYNLNQDFTISADLMFEPTVKMTSGVIGFFYDSIDNEHLLIPDSAHSFKDGLQHLTEKITYSEKVSTTLGTSTLSARYEPYHIRSLLVPGVYSIGQTLPTNTSDYPSINESVTQSLQINPSMVLTSSTYNGVLYNGVPSVQYNDPVDYFIITSTLVTGNMPFTGGNATFTFTHQTAPSRVITYSMPFTNDVATFNTNLMGNVIQDGIQNVNNVFDLIQGGYVVTCHASFDEMYKEVDEDASTNIYSDARFAPFNLTFSDNYSTGYNIIYNTTRPTIQITFPSDNVYGGAFTITVGPNTYTLTLTNDVNSALNSYQFQIPDDLVVGLYTISATYSSLPNFSSVSNNSIYLVVDKAAIHVNPLSDYYMNTNATGRSTDSSITITGTLDTVLGSTSVIAVIQNTNDQFSVVSSDGTFSITISGLNTTYDAGTYDLFLYCTGDSNYNKSDFVYTNMVVQKQTIPSSTVTFGSLDMNYNYPIVVSGIVSTDTVYIYTESQVDPLVVFKPNTSYLIPDYLLQTGNNVITAIISGVNHEGKSSPVTIPKPQISTTLMLSSDNTDIYYTGVVSFTANVSCNRTDNMVNINEGYVVFTVNGSVVGQVQVDGNNAKFHIALVDMNVNTVSAQFVNSQQYANSISNNVSVNVYKNNLTNIQLIDTTPDLNNVMDMKVLLLQIGDNINRSDTPYNNINTGLVKFTVNGRVLYDNVAVTNGLVTLNFYIEDHITYNIIATFNGNENYNPTSSNTIIINSLVSNSISDVYTSVTRDNSSGVSNGYCTVSATVASSDSRLDHLNSGDVTFVYEGVVRVIPLLNGNASTLFVSSNVSDVPSITYTNTAFSGYLVDASGAWP
jgi:hypothetical protein